MEARSGSEVGWLRGSLHALPAVVCLKGWPCLCSVAGRSSLGLACGFE